MGNKLVEALSKITTTNDKVTKDILVINFRVVTACLVGKENEWVLVDTGLENSAEYILDCANEMYGANSKPKAIILTHGHFDHVGSVKKLSEYWDVPVYIHSLELPYVTGQKDYPLGDPSVDNGMVAKLSPTFPHTSINIGNRAKALPEDGTVPSMKGWRWIHTPGHTEGHISLFRDKDKTLIVGDAFSTTKQESLWSVLTQKEEIEGPPKYLTTDWLESENSIKRLAELKPNIAIPSHGKPMSGITLDEHLEKLVRDFNDIAKPDQGKFINWYKKD